MKNFWVEKSKTWGLKSLSSLQYSNKFFEKAWKKKKKKQHQRDWEHWKGSISAIGVNAAQTKELQ